MYSERILSFNLSMILYRCDVLQALSCPLPCDPLYLYHEHIGYHIVVSSIRDQVAHSRNPLAASQRCWNNAVVLEKDLTRT
jgi:hypothetical protein